MNQERLNRKSNKRYSKLVPREGFVYLFKCNSLDGIVYKIGMSKDPIKRLKQINDCSPVKVVLCKIITTNDMKMLEECFHKLFLRKNVNKLKKEKISSVEWFKLNEKDYNFINNFKDYNCQSDFSDTIKNVYHLYYKQNGNRYEI